MLNVELPLLLLKAWVLFVDHVQPAFPSHDLAISAAFFNRCSYFHCLSFFCRVADVYLYLKIILPLVRSYGLISTPTLSPGRIRI